MSQSTLGATIRARRLELGWSQQDLAARVSDAGGECQQSDVSRLERGKITLPRHARLAALAQVLDLPLGELLARSGWGGYGEAVGTLTTATNEAARRLAVDTGEHRPEPRAADAEGRMARALRAATATREESARLLQHLAAQWGPEPRAALARRTHGRIPEESGSPADAEAGDGPARHDAPPETG